MMKHFPCLKIFSASIIFGLSIACFSSTSTLAANLLSAQSHKAYYGKYGGPFKLVDQTGNTVTDKNYRGKYLLVFFGYTFCPDVCPTALQILSASLDLMGDAENQIQPIFISVDPNRDTPEVLASYVNNFGHNLVGLTGDQKNIDEVAKAYGARYEKDTAPDGSPVTGNDYFISHSAGTYMMDRQGKYLVTFPMGVSPEDMAYNLTKIMKSH